MKDFKYIIKRIIIGVAIAIILMLIKGSLVLNVEAKTRVRFYGSNNSLCETKEDVGSSYVFYTGISGPSYCESISRVSISDDSYILQSGVHYRLSSSMYLDIWRPNHNCVNDLYTRGDVYIGNYNANQWNNASTITWNRIDGITDGIDSSCRYNWGLVQDWNNTVSSNGMTFDFYFQQGNFPVMFGMQINRFQLENLTQGGDNAQATINAINNQTNAYINNNNSNTNKLLNDDTSNASTSIAGKLSNFHFNTYGLTGIVTAPLRFFESLLSSTCSSLSFPLPFVHNNVTLPCMSAIYQQFFPTFLTLYRLITNGVIGYWVCVKIFQKVKGFLDPTDDKVEVFDL